MDETLLQFALGELPAEELEGVRRRLDSNPSEAAQIERIRLVLGVLEEVRATSSQPPANLVQETIARVAGAVVAAPRPVIRRPAPPTLPMTPRRTPPEGHPVPRSRPSGPVIFSWRWADVTVAAGIGLLAVGITLTAIGRIRQENQLLACQKQMQELHVALTHHADASDGRFPQVGIGEVPSAGKFVIPLARTGNLSKDLLAVCPAADPDDASLVEVPRGDDWKVTRVGYTYNLGYRGGDGTLLGIRRGEKNGDSTPVAADMPSREASPMDGPVSPHPRGQNVLYLDGSVRFCTSGKAGVNGDDIYRNDAGVVHAGLRPEDATLGRPGDVP